MAKNTIEINKSLIPYTFNIVLGSEEYAFRVDYNNEGGFFTVELSKNGKTLCSGEPLMYGRALFSDIKNNNYPIVNIVPHDPAGNYSAVTYDNLCDRVLLVIDNEEESVIGR